MRLIILALGLLVAAGPAPALADIGCVQRELTRLGYDPGPVDGMMGGRTRGAAQSFAQDQGLALPELSGDTSAQWCNAVKEKTADLPRFDLVSAPAGVLSSQQTKRLWNAYKSARVCFDHPIYGKHPPLNVVPLSSSEAAAGDWTSPFSVATGNKACMVVQPDFGWPPAPMPVVTLDESYGERVLEADAAADWFRRASTFARLSNDPEARDRLRAAIVAWAKADSLGRGIHVSWGQKPVDYQMMTLIIGLVAATAEVADDLTDEEKKIVGPWLSNLVDEASDSRWKDRQDNKEYMRTYLTLIWALVSGDDAAAQQAIDIFKLAIHDVRPDGSFPVDSQRSGMGVDYNSKSTSYLVMAAAAIRNTSGLDLLAYEVDGKSGHTAVDFVVRSIQDPSGVNSQYAISCPEGGDRWGTIENPSLGFIKESAYLLAYADMYPDRPASEWIRTEYAGRFREAAISELAGGAPACQFASDIDPDYVAAPVKITTYDLPSSDFVVGLPDPDYVVHTREETAHSTGTNAKINSLMFAEIESPGDQPEKFGFSLLGDYTIATGQMTRLEFSIQQPLGSSAPDGLERCLGFTTSVHDDGQHRLTFQMAGLGARFTAPDLACLDGVVPDEVAKAAAFLSNHMQDIAIGMFVDGTISDLQNVGLREWLKSVAQGDVTIQEQQAWSPPE